jgi:protein-L-isoaspartate(D-aspartate) O-methyltransferase
VTEQIACRGVSDPRVLDAMRKVPRHEFVAEGLRHNAYEDHPLPVGSGQTISQPYMVAAMTEALKPGKEDRVLEIGTGSGYQAAVLADLARMVYTIELVQELSLAARRALHRIGCRNVRFRVGDGHEGWAEFAPFDRIMVTAGAATFPHGTGGSRLADPYSRSEARRAAGESFADGLRVRAVCEGEGMTVDWAGFQLNISACCQGGPQEHDL